MHHDIFKCEDYAGMTGINDIEMMISGIAVDSHHTDFSIFPARRVVHMYHIVGTTKK